MILTLASQIYFIFHRLEVALLLTAMNEMEKTLVIESNSKQ